MLTNALVTGSRIYSAAYIMPSGGRNGESRKHRDHLRLIERMMRDGVAAQLRQCKSTEQGFQVLRSYPMVGDFLAYQFITDINYSTQSDFSAMEFTVPGPGARDGIHKCFESIGELSPSDVIGMMADIQDQQFVRLGLRFRSLWGDRRSWWIARTCSVRSVSMRGVDIQASVDSRAARESSRSTEWTHGRCRIGTHRSGISTTTHG